MGYSDTIPQIRRHHDLSSASPNYTNLVRYVTLSASSHNTQPWKFQPEAVSKLIGAVLGLLIVLSGSRSVLDELVREGARRTLQEALELEVEEFVDRRREKRDERGRRAVVRNGCFPAREVAEQEEEEEGTEVAFGPIPSAYMRAR